MVPNAASYWRPYSALDLSILSNRFQVSISFWWTLKMNHCSQSGEILWRQLCFQSKDSHQNKSSYVIWLYIFKSCHFTPGEIIQGIIVLLLKQYRHLLMAEKFCYPKIWYFDHQYCDLLKEKKNRPGLLFLFFFFFYFQSLWGFPFPQGLLATGPWGKR